MVLELAQHTALIAPTANTRWTHTLDDHMPSLVSSDSEKNAVTDKTSDEPYRLQSNYIATAASVHELELYLHV